jgi:hypothetical protein
MTTKWPNLNVKTRPEQLGGYLLPAFVIPVIVAMLTKESKQVSSKAKL